MTKTEAASRNVNGAIAVRPRSITRHPLLNSIYQRHDELIAEFTTGRTLEVAFGRHPHPLADVGVEAFPENNQFVDSIDAVTADARSLPFTDNSFQTIIGRRFLHHVPVSGRQDILTEARRTLSDDGKLVLLEGTPGLYRRLTKEIAFKIGALGDDNDEYGHLAADSMAKSVRQAGFEIVELRSLGSPLMPFCILEGEWTRQLMGIYQRTQFIRWWTFIVAKPTQPPE